MNLYLIGYSTEDSELESEIKDWIGRYLIFNFDDKMFIVRPDTETKFINDLKMMFLGKGKFFLTRWREPVTFEPPHLFPAPEKDVEEI